MPRVVEILKKLTALFLFKIWHLFIKDPVYKSIGHDLFQIAYLVDYSQKDNQI